jgi:diaminopimelate epimerase
VEIKFDKYQGTGNDFVILDNRDGKYSMLPVAHICDRKFGIGADGLMLLENSSEEDFKMVYYNSDGAISSMCGNGGRCLVHFANKLGVIGNKCEFIAIDGLHEAQVNGSTVELKMNNVTAVDKRDNAFVLDTGSPHYVSVNSELPGEDFVQIAKGIRYNDEFTAEGINVNFISGKDNSIEIRTYERGVEDETLSCGTGVTAAAIAFHQHANGTEGDFEYAIKSMGGDLKVRFTFSSNEYNNVWLIGPATHVFSGSIEI